MDIQYVSQSTGLRTPISRYACFLGKGAFGSAYELYNQNGVSTGFVCKTVEVKPVDDIKASKRDILRDTINEIHTLKTMGLLEGYARKDDTFYIIMKKVNGREANISSWDQDSTQSSFNALRDCHRQDITHFDGHSGNFITDTHTSKTTAIDFGQSNNATFINILLDTWIFLFKNNLRDNSAFNTLALSLKLFMVDYLTYVSQNKIEVLINIIWWSGLIYGAIYGIPALMQPNHFFYDYLKSRFIFQSFLELRSIALLRWEIPAAFSTHFMTKNTFKKLLDSSVGVFLFKAIMKPVYFVALELPRSQLKAFHEANTKLVEKLWAALTKNKVADNAAAVVETIKTAQASIGYDTNKELLENFYELLTKEKITSMLTAPTTHTCFQAALLYHPIKAGLTFINDAVINPPQPEFVAKARADLYFQHHPMLYAKTAANTFYNTAASCVNYVNTQKPAFS